jgi:hypothetical protein
MLMASCNIDYTLIDSDEVADQFNAVVDGGFESNLTVRMLELLPDSIKDNLTPEQQAALDSAKAKVLAATQVSAADVASAEAATNEAMASVTESTIKSSVLSKASAQNLADSQAVAQAHDVFNAEAALTYPEPIFSEPKYTSPINIQDVNYTLKEDYPHSYGDIDEVGNWWKVNKKKSLIEFVHNSGSFIQIDRDGNMTQHITGSKKEVILGDLSVEVMGNKDTLIHGNQYTHIDKKKTTLVDGNVDSVINGTETKTVVKDVSLTYKANLTWGIKGNDNWSIGGSTNRTTSGTLSINGATIDLN